MKLFCKEQTLFQQKTRYNNITVTQRDNEVTLWCGNARQTAIYTGIIFEPRLEYARNFFFSLAFHPDPISILVLGLGGGAIPTMLHNLLEQAEIDVVEIDPLIPVVARKYFQFTPSSRLKLHIKDASEFIRQNVSIFDMVLLDSYIEDKIPRRLTKLDFLEDAARILSPRGIFSANLINADRLRFNSLVKRMTSIFRDVWLLDCSQANNTLVFAAKREIDKDSLIINARNLEKRLPFDLNPDFLLKKLIHHSSA